MHLAHSCNLRCENCSHYSNYDLGGIVPFSEGATWLQAWAPRVEPLRFSFLGGEPLLNPEVSDYLRLARQVWPHTLIRLVTNGLLLERWGEPLWEGLAETETLITVSIHSRDAKYSGRMAKVLQTIRIKTEQYGIRWEKRDSINGWYRLYRGSGPGMTPFTDGSPESSWKSCQNKHCVTLQDNSLWKCPPIAHLPRVAAKLGLDRHGVWSLPLAYQPLTLDANDDEVRLFFGRRAESICSMCPAKLEYFEKSIY
jgi:Radical SAM superfamily/4Fe-4S single cluster domain